MTHPSSYSAFVAQRDDLNEKLEGLLDVLNEAREYLAMVSSPSCPWPEEAPLAQAKIDELLAEKAKIDKQLGAIEVVALDWDDVDADDDHWDVYPN